jgi:protein-L-isoaspartate(D-aspartate) O-methyltransferase
MLSRLCRWVHTIERLEVHSTHAREVLDRVGAINVTSHFGNGYYGLPEHAPYDRIIVTAGIDHLPEALWEQVKEGGWIVIPLNGSLTTIFKIDGNPVINYGEEVRFVPFVKD